MFLLSRYCPHCEENASDETKINNGRVEKHIKIGAFLEISLNREIA